MLVGCTKGWVCLQIKCQEIILRVDTASDIPVTGEWALTGKKLDSYLSMGERRGEEREKKEQARKKGDLYTVELTFLHGFFLLSTNQKKQQLF